MKDSISHSLAINALTKKIHLEHMSSTIQRPHRKDEKLWTNSDNGLTVVVYQIGKSVRSSKFDEGTRMGKMHFRPDGDAYRNPERITANTLAGLVGLQNFLNEVGLQKPEPEYLHGVTNKPMAQITRRLGFAVEKVSPRLSRKGIHFFQVVGETATVRENLSNLLEKTDAKGRTKIEVLYERVHAKSYA